jgi:hypothetical protein
MPAPSTYKTNRLVHEGRVWLPGPILGLSEGMPSGGCPVQTSFEPPFALCLVGCEAFFVPMEKWALTI